MKSNENLESDNITAKMFKYGGIILGEQIYKIKHIWVIFPFHKKGDRIECH